MKLGFFDSGLGGLFVMEEVRRIYPEHDYLFLGDTDHLPYGPRESEEIAQFITPLIRHLVDNLHCDHVIVACNTASVRALPLFLEKFPQYREVVHGIDEPTTAALSAMELSELLVLATERTVRSGAYEHIGSTKIDQQAMPGLVDLIEIGDREGALLMVRDALSYHHVHSNVLLGCTHYLWLKDELSTIYPEYQFIGQGTIVAGIIGRLTQEKEVTVPGSVRYLVTGDPSYYQQHQHRDVEHLNLSAEI